MIKEILKNNLLSYIETLIGKTDNLDNKSYEELVAIYIDLLSISKEEFDKYIEESIAEYHQEYPEDFVEDYQIIADMGLLEPTNIIPYNHVEQHILELTKEINDLKSNLEFYSQEIVSDEAKLENPNLRSDEASEIWGSDLPYEKKVAREYPEKIIKLNNELLAKKIVLSNLGNFYNKQNEEEVGLKY